MNNVNNVKFDEFTTIESDEDDFENPIDLSDIINVCKEYNKLGWKLQNQIDCITEMGIDDAIKSGSVNLSSLPIIKDFLKAIKNNPLFGDASFQAEETISNIKKYEMLHPHYNRMTN